MICRSPAPGTCSRPAAPPASRRSWSSPARPGVSAGLGALVLPLGLALALPGSADAQGGDRPPTDIARLDAYLERLGLTSLRIRNLERELERARDRGASAGIALRLAEVYADRLLSESDPKEEAELAARLTRLVHDHPAAGTPRLRLTLLEGEYNRAETRALRWIADPGDPATRADALSRLGHCRPELDRVRDEDLKRIEAIEKELERLSDGPRFEAVERELGAVSRVASRALYFAAWANLYEGLLSGDSPGDRLRAARRGFLRLLGAEEAADLKADDFDGLDNETTARIALGLALAESSGDDNDRGKDAFRALRGAEVYPGVRDWVDRWEIWAMLRAGRADEAEAAARAAVEALSPPFTPGRGALCAVLIRGAGPTGSGADRDRAFRLAMLGIRGLIRLGRPDLARQLLAGRDLSATAPAGVMAQWLRGQAALRAAENGRGPEGYSQAQAAFAAARSAPDAGGEPILVADCRLGEAWCLYRLGDLPSARDAFRQAAEDQRARAIPSADAEWMALLTDWNLSEDPPQRRIDRIAAEARAFRDRHPDHEAARRVDEVVDRLRRELAATMTPAAGPSDDPVVLLARVRELHRQWGGLAAAERAASPLSASLADAARGALARIHADRDPAGRVDVLLIEADLALSASPPDIGRARTALAEAARLSAKLRPGDSRIAEERFRQFQLARAESDEAGIRQHARWLADHPGDPAHERAALAALAEQVDAAHRAAAASDRRARAAEALEIHRRLASLLADFPDRVRTNPTLRLVYTRMAQYALDADQPRAAARYAALLQKARPDDPRILRLAGLAYSRSDQPDAALACWRTLIERLPRDSPDWYEAKFYQIDGLTRIDPPRARRAWEQFRILHPALGPEPWPARFRELASRLP